MGKIFTFIFIFLFSIHLFGQNNVGIGTPNPDVSALLELMANNKGFLVPRMSAAERLAIPTPANAL